tara:strand:+ start:323 stop:1462 length:1140 start_codon:yes stop_codon:yes gene_type:complete
MQNAVRSLVRASQDLMLGICADDADTAIATLKGWVSALALPRGLLHGMDDGQGRPIDTSSFGAIFIKYVSRPSDADPPGTAFLSAYMDGEVRGVYFNPELGDGDFRQYGALPLGLFDAEHGPIGDALLEQIAPREDPLKKMMTTASGGGRSAAVGSSPGGAIEKPAATDSWPAATDSWLPEWRKRLEGWWLAVPSASATLERCIGALGLVLGSRFTSFFGRGRAAPPPAPQAVEPGCEWVGERADELGLPDFPNPPSEFRDFRLPWPVLPPIPRLLPAARFFEHHASASAGATVAAGARFRASAPGSTVATAAPGAPSTSEGGRFRAAAAPLGGLAGFVTALLVFSLCTARRRAQVDAMLGPLPRRNLRGGNLPGEACI